MGGFFVTYQRPLASNVSISRNINSLSSGEENTNSFPYNPTPPGGNYYMRAVEIKDKIYVLPGNAQNILVIKNKQIKKIHCYTGGGISYIDI